MSKSQQGFSHIIVPLVLVLVAVTGSGYLVYMHQHTKQLDADSAAASKSGSTTASTLALPANQANSASGVGTAINNLATSLNTSEKALYGQYNTNDQSSDASLGIAATNVGGSYDASSY